MKVQVVAYDENWVRLFQQEAEKLKQIFAKESIEIHHIGSTSVPELHAKPIIDHARGSEHQPSRCLQLGNEAYRLRMHG